MNTDDLKAQRDAARLERKARNRKRYERRYARLKPKRDRVFRRIDGSVDQYLG